MQWLDETRNDYPIELIWDYDADKSNDVIHWFLTGYISSGTAFKISSSGKATKTRPDENGSTLREIYKRLTKKSQERYSLGLDFKSSPFTDEKFAKNALLTEIRSTKTRKARRTQKNKRIAHCITQGSSSNDA